MRKARVLVVAVVTAFTMACGGSGTPASIDAAATADATPSPDGGGTADAGALPRGHAGSGNVAGGVKASSPNFKLVGTMGKGDGTSSSPSFKHHGGVVGGTQP